MYWHNQLPLATTSYCVLTMNPWKPITAPSGAPPKVSPQSNTENRQLSEPSPTSWAQYCLCWHRPMQIQHIFSSFDNPCMSGGSQKPGTKPTLHLNDEGTQIKGVNHTPRYNFNRKPPKNRPRVVTTAVLSMLVWLLNQWKVLYHMYFDVYEVIVPTQLNAALICCFSDNSTRILHSADILNTQST